MADSTEEVIEGERCLSDMEYQKAHKHFSKAIQLDNKNARGYFGMAEASIGLPETKVEEVVSLYRKAIELEPNNPQYMEAYASFCMDVGYFNEAEKYFRKASEADPEAAPYYFSEFAIQYYTKAPVIMAGRMDDDAREIVARKSLDYLLKALNITKEEALRLLK